MTGEHTLHNPEAKPLYLQKTDEKNHYPKKLEKNKPCVQCMTLKQKKQHFLQVSIIWYCFACRMLWKISSISDDL